ncbi:MAG: hypothetical protein PWP28_2160 [Oceanotoga sp.]|nr:hypothetical protein [Oceanotoga sp.]
MGLFFYIFLFKNKKLEQIKTYSIIIINNFIKINDITFYKTIHNDI